MKSFGVKARSGLTLLKGGVSMVALTALAATLVAPAYAQDAQPAASGDAQEVVVVGVRKALKSAQQIKKDADTVVDSITANDIGSFPDKSVAEALQRVAGITVNRFAATGDTAHFSAEPSGVVVRGLQQVRSEFNGRDIFTADSSRGLSWSDVSPELMGGVDVYKNQTADLIEGGIAGTVNLKTRLPFDQKGRVLAGTFEYTWGDITKKGTGAVSGIYANRWQTDLGEFGLMVNGAHSEVVTASQGIQFGRYAAIVSPAFGSVITDPTADLWINPTKKYLPGSAAIRNNEYDRTRDGVAIAGQWQNNDHTMLLTLQYQQSKKREEMEEHVLSASSGTDSYAKPLTWASDGSGASICLPGTTCTFNSEGGLISGTPVTSIDTWMATYPANTGAPDATNPLTCYSWTCDDGSHARGTRYTTTARYSDSVNDTKDVALNFKWDPSDRLKLNFDIQHVEATQTNYDIDGSLKTFANVNYDLTGNHPVFTVTDPSSFNDLPGNITNPANYEAAYIMDHVTDSDGKMDAARFDLAYSFDSPWMNTLKAGVRFADRQQTVRWSIYNWKVSIRDWENYDKDNFYITGSAFPANAYESITLPDNFYGGGVTNAPTGIFYRMDLIKNREAFAAMFGNQSYQPVNTSDGITNEWAPVCYRTGEEACFLPAELSNVEEKTNAAYVQLKFGGPDATIFGGVTVTGNVGVRYVQTQNISTGGVNYPSSVTYSTTATSVVNDPITGNPVIDPVTGQQVVAYNYTYFISAEDRAFLTSSTAKATADITHKNWLPSFNVRLGLTDQWFLRFAASRAMSRPDIGNLKAYSSVNFVSPTQADIVCGKALECTGGVPTKAVMTYTGSAQNPYLTPITADQFDFTIENYFSSTGSWTFNGFYKKFHDYIQYGSYYRNFTNNGVTREVLMNGPVNGDGASIKGFELAYQSFFDFLPAPFNGLGIQANYTHLVNSGINSAGVARETADPTGSADPNTGGIGRAANAFLGLPLEGLSDDAYNLVGMYEKGAWSARVAYNWRSRFMVTGQDCCTTFPVWQKEAGYLDARLAYRINDNVEVSVEGTNLLNTETRLQQQVDGPTTAYPDREARFLDSSWFKNDRRLQASVRLKY
jgi:iron complex outermembrane receptor protein